MKNFFNALLLKFHKVLRASVNFVFSFLRITCDFDGSENWGDKLTPVLVERLTGRKCQLPIFDFQHRFFVIGSILHRVNKKSTVWGAGFISKNSRPVAVPKKIFAVRGPLTRELFLKFGVSCPEVYGDPAILLGDLYPRNKVKKFKYGVVPHYVDKNNKWINKQIRSYQEEVLFIDIEGGIEDVINKIVRCEYVVSSSLHGLICADVYGVPSIRVVLSDLVVGGDFKFYDYRLGVGHEPHKPVNPEFSNLSLPELIKYHSLADVERAKRDLLSNCPFLNIKNTDRL